MGATTMTTSTPDLIAELLGELRLESHAWATPSELVPNRQGVAALFRKAADVIDALAARLAEIEADDKQASHDALHDLVMLRAEEFAIGGGPGFKERQEKAWRAAEEIFEP